jgi:hypothetical protein
VSDDDGTMAEIEETLAAATESAGGAVQPYPRAGRAIKQVVLRDSQDSGGSRFEVAVLEDDGAVRVTGVDEGPGVSDALGRSITSYDWVYVVPHERVPLLLTELGGPANGDVLDHLAQFYAQAGGGQMGQLLRAPPVNASFDNWMS